MQVYHSQDNCVSVWIGNFPDEDTLDACIDAEIAPSLALGEMFDDIAEDTWEPEPIPVHDLMDGFQDWEGFVGAAVEVATGYQVEAANSALVAHGIICQDAPAQWGHFYFLGSFEKKRIRKRRRHAAPSSEEW